MNIDNVIGENGMTDIIHAVSGIAPLKMLNLDGLKVVESYMIIEQETMRIMHLLSEC